MGRPKGSKNKKKDGAIEAQKPLNKKVSEEKVENKKKTPKPNKIEVVKETPIEEVKEEQVAPTIEIKEEAPKAEKMEEQSTVEKKKKLVEINRGLGLVWNGMVMDF